ncbi:hypothetical protein B0T26DRAFT_355690 [Lasiosphaeria miniovina]|uniref:Uncharacterized protein n=1 Tax=Lasiosphaeria miniovina TaxID=1954250 RepID=A0AA40DR56_9PEZI|nr:uncharacterized protein B0T26DRAFT_355690 [Lasiosphaeria miniovina]KAK0713104.1 hypothetical protein B0T26DRAFT_355690 [Lasiosphaeria miniovina]
MRWTRKGSLLTFLSDFIVLPLFPFLLHGSAYFFSTSSLVRLTLSYSSSHCIFTFGFPAITIVNGRSSGTISVGSLALDTRSVSPSLISLSIAY